MTTATITAPREALALLGRLTELLLSWSFEGTLTAEETVKRVGRAYGLEPELTVLTVGERTLAFAGAPTVPPLDQYADF